MYFPQDASIPPTPQQVSQTRGHKSGYRSNRSNNSTFDAGQKYEAIITKLKKMLDLERNNLRAARTAYARELQSKTELEQILRQCVEDVKQEIINRKSEMRLYKSELAEEEQEKILEVLFSQERVLTLLYDKTFPPRSIVREPLYENLEGKYLNNLEHIDQNIENIERMYDLRQNELANQTEQARINYD